MQEPETAANAPQPRRHPLDHLIPPPLVVLCVGALMGAATSLAPPWEVAPIVTRTAGAAIILVGLSLTATGAITFQRARTTIDPIHPNAASTIVTGGVFSRTRNPMYVGFTIMLLGWAVVLASPWQLLGPVAFALYTNRFQIVPEERALAAKFGDAYEQYRSSVPRWL